jgi:hypothetical protein
MHAIDADNKPIYRPIKPENEVILKQNIVYQR